MFTVLHCVAFTGRSSLSRLAAILIQGDNDEE
jgi:hypothetical protein